MNVTIIKAASRGSVLASAVASQANACSLEPFGTLRIRPDHGQGTQVAATWPAR